MKIALSLFGYAGVEGQTVDSLLGELQLAMASGVQILYSRVGSDALISRSRSKAMSAFLDTDADVLFFVDRDICWPVGSIIETCRQAMNRYAIVGGMYSMRAKGAGFAGRPKGVSGQEFDIRIGADQLIEAEFVASGFAAYPRLVVEEVLKAGLEASRQLSTGESMANWVEKRPWDLAVNRCLYADGTSFYDFFRPFTIASRLAHGHTEYLSEDWAFCERARMANPVTKQWFWAKPVLGHVGQYIYTLHEAAQEIAPKPKILTATH